MTAPVGHWGSGDEGTADRHNSGLTQYVAFASLPTDADYQNMMAIVSDGIGGNGGAPAVYVRADGTASWTLAGTLMQMATGSYTGDGATSQAITGLGFRPRLLYITQRLTTGQAMPDRSQAWTSDVITDDSATGMAITMDTGAIPYETYESDAIVSLDSDGFTVDDAGADVHPNANTIVYNYWAIG